jgi:N-acyl-D-amino-acid deacylase
MGRTVLRNGRILDGTGNPWVQGDLAIEGERIVEIGAVGPVDGDVEVDIQGHMVCPGFIDIHTHSDTTFLLDKYASSKLCQGVTTEVVGNCGLSCAPLTGDGGQTFLQVNHQLFGEDLVASWESMAEYLCLLEQNGLPLNVAAMAGHSTVRACVMGYATRPPTRDELDKMGRVLGESLEAGAFGMTLGYKPGDQADEAELAHLGRIVAAYGGFVSDHTAQLALRAGHAAGEDSYLGMTSIIRKLLRVGAEAQVPVHIAHVKAIGPAAWGRAGWITDLIDRARAQGTDATCDLYGYAAGGGALVGLFAPQFLLEAADSQDVPASIRVAVADPATKRRALGAIEGSFRGLGGADKVRILTFPPDPGVEGKTFQDIAEATGEAPAVVALEYLQQGDARLRCEVMLEKDVMHLMQHPASMICSDATSMSLAGWGEKEMVHPRTFGAFPRILRRYVTEFGALSLPEAVRKMAWAPAQRLGLRDRGRLAAGCYADVVVFDPEQIADLATYADPYRLPRGIRRVYVNGTLAVSEGEFQRTLVGKVLRKKEN